MTAKHRKGKSNHKQEDNFFKSEILETEVRPGGKKQTYLLVLVLIGVIGCIIGAWFCIQQHLTLTDLSDNVMGIQGKIAKLQSSHEELRLSNTKQHVSENVETRLASLEESYALAQKKVGMALAKAEQLKTSDLPAQVLSLHTEMKTRLAEVQQSTVSLEQLNHLQSILMGKSKEIEDIRMQVEDLAALSGELSQKVEGLSMNLAEADSKLEEKIGHIATMSATLDGQTNEMLKMKNQMDTYKDKLENSLLETTNLREVFEDKESQLFLKANEEEQVVDQIKPPAEHLENMEADAAEEQEVADDEAVPDYEKELAADEEEKVATATVEEKAVAETEEEEETVAIEEKKAAAGTEQQVEDADTNEEEEMEAVEPEEEMEAIEPEEEEGLESDEEDAAEPEEQMEKADVNDTEDQTAAGVEEAPTHQERKEVPGEEDTEKTGEEILPAAEDDQGLSSKKETEASLQQEEYAAEEDQDESSVEQKDRETEETAMEKEQNEMEHEKFIAGSQGKTDCEEKVQEDTPVLEKNQETVMEDEEKEGKNGKMKDDTEERQKLSDEEGPWEGEDESSEEFASLKNK